MPLSLFDHLCLGSFTLYLSTGKASPLWHFPSWKTSKDPPRWNEVPWETWVLTDSKNPSMGQQQQKYCRESLLSQSVSSERTTNVNKISFLWSFVPFLWHYHWRQVAVLGLITEIYLSCLERSPHMGTICDSWMIWSGLNWFRGWSKNICTTIQMLV